MTTRNIPVASIDAGNRVRVIDPKWVALLAEEIAVDGLIQPIRVVERGERFMLVDGARRLAAHHQLGWDEIAADVEDAAAFADDAAVRLGEIKGNMLRGDLTVLDRARYIAAWREVHETLHPQPKRRRKAKDATPADLEEMSAQCANIFTEVAKEALGLSQRSIYLHLKIATIAPQAATAIALHPAADHRGELQLLAGQSEARQVAIVDMLVAEPARAQSVAEALMLLGGAPASTPVAVYERLNDRLSALKAAERERIYELRAEEIELWVARRNSGNRARVA